MFLQIGGISAMLRTAAIGVSPGNVGPETLPWDIVQTTSIAIDKPLRQVYFV